MVARHIRRWEGAGIAKPRDEMNLLVVTSCAVLWDLLTVSTSTIRSNYKLTHMEPDGPAIFLSCHAGTRMRWVAHIARHLSS